MYLLQVQGNLGSSVVASWGFADSSKTNYCMYSTYTPYYQTSTSTLIVLNTAGSTDQNATIASYDADGFTLTWTKTGSPTGTATLLFICYK